MALSVLCQPSPAGLRAVPGHHFTGYLSRIRSALMCVNSFFAPAQLAAMKGSFSADRPGFSFAFLKDIAWLQVNKLSALN
jgi:hypothetical protein